MPVDEEGVNNFFQKRGAKSNRLLVRPFRFTYYYYRLIFWGAHFFLLRPGYILAQICRIPGALSGQALQGVIMVKRE